MITLNAMLERVHGLDADTLHIWITQQWVRPITRGGEPVFEDVDIARVRLIIELRDDMEVGESAIPVVLSLLDQLHATRRDLRRLSDALQARTPQARTP